MTSVTISSSRSQRRRDAHRRQAPVPASRLASDTCVRPDPASPVNPHQHGGAVVFEVRFRSSMTGRDLELLRHQLDMTTHVEHKLPVDPNSPAHAQLDQGSSLLLERGTAEDQWILQARTWSKPSARTVHDWHVRVALVAHQLDPVVVIPDRLAVAPSSIPQRPVGRAVNRRLAATRRRLVGLS